MKNFIQPFFFTLSLLLCTSITGQTFGEAFGTNSDYEKSISAQNEYPTVREFHLWTDDQNYPTESNSVGYPLQDFDFSVTDDYYRQRRGAIINTAFGIPGEMRGLTEGDFQTAGALKWFSQKPFVPFGYREQSTSLTGATGFFLDNNGTSQYFGDWIASPDYPQNEPATWRDKARWMSLLAERYGDASLLSTSANPSTIDDYERLYDGQVTGAGTSRSPVVFFEAENEPDRHFWEPNDDPNGDNVTPKVEFNTARTMWQTRPVDLAAQTSMLYDGHGKSPASIFPPASVIPAGENGYYHLGVKNVGPKNKVAIAGLAGLRGKYIEDMLDWFIDFRKVGELGFTDATAPVMPFEAISFHHYPASTSEDDLGESEYYNSTVGQWNTFGGTGESPERHKLRPRLTFFLNSLGTAFDEKGYLSKWHETEVWLSEFGYDSNNRDAGVCFSCSGCGTDDNCPPGQVRASSGVQIPFIQDVNEAMGVTLNKELLQAQWLSRSYLEIMATKGQNDHRVDRFMQFELIDTEDTDLGGPAGGVFATCGLYRQNGIPKPSHFYTKTMLHQLEDFDHDFTSGGGYDAFPTSISLALDYSSASGNGLLLPYDVNDFDPDADENLPVAYRYNRQYGGDESRLIVWSPTQAGYRYHIDLDVNEAFGFVSSKVTMIELVDGSTIGRPTELSVSNGKVTIPVSETPIILQPGSLGSTTLVSTVDNVIFEDYCCGNLEASWSRVRRTLRRSVDVYYIAADDVSGTLVPFRNLIPIEEGFAGTRITLPQLVPGESYYLVLLPTNRYGYGVDISEGVDFSPSANLAHLVIPSVCTDGAGECVTDIPASSITVTAGFVPSSALTTVFSGGEDADGDGLSCNISNPYTLDPQWGANGQGTFSAEVTFNPPVNIERIQLIFGGVNPIGSNFQIDVKTCECPYWKSYGSVTPVQGESFQLAANKSRVTSVRLTNTQANLAAMLICSEPANCSDPFFDEEPNVEVSAVAKRRATVSWTPAFNTLGQEEANGYFVELSKSLDDGGYLVAPEVTHISTNVGGSLSHKLLDLEPGQEYFGRLLPENNCLEAYNAPSLFRPYNAEDTAYFNFTTQQESEEENPKQAADESEPKEAPIQAVGVLEKFSEVYPNPSSGALQIAASEQLLSVTIQDLQGRILGYFDDFDSNKVNLDISKFESGMLVVFVNTETSSDTHLVRLE